LPALMHGQQDWMQKLGLEAEFQDQMEKMMHSSAVHQR